MLKLLHMFLAKAMHGKECPQTAQTCCPLPVHGCILQGGYKHMAMTDSLWNGFEHVFCTLSILTLARGEARTFVKAQGLKHALCLRIRRNMWTLIGLRSGLGLRLENGKGSSSEALQQCRMSQAGYARQLHCRVYQESFPVE